MLSNGDIFFNETLQALDNYDLTGKMLALTRWSLTAAGNLFLCWLLDKKGVFLEIGQNILKMSGF